MHATHKFRAAFYKYGFLGWLVLVALIQGCAPAIVDTRDRNHGNWIVERSIHLKEIEYWSKISKSNAPNKYAEYLKRYPKGIYADDIRKKRVRAYPTDGIWEIRYEFFYDESADCGAVDIFPWVIAKNRVDSAFWHPHRSVTFDGKIDKDGNVLIMSGAGEITVEARGKFTGDKGQGRFNLFYPIAGVDCYADWFAEKVK